MEVKLEALSPLAFDLLRPGHVVRLQFKPSDRREYRDKIVARDCFLVFRGQTKIGMVPIKIGIEHGDEFRQIGWKVKEVNKSGGVVSISNEGVNRPG